MSYQMRLYEYIYDISLLTFSVKRNQIQKIHSDLISKYGIVQLF